MLICKWQWMSMLDEMGIWLRHRIKLIWQWNLKVAVGIVLSSIVSVSKNAPAGVRN